jgi:hypothetical protein
MNLARKYRESHWEWINPHKIRWAGWRKRQGSNMDAVQYYIDNPNGRYPGGTGEHPFVVRETDGSLSGHNGWHRQQAAMIAGRALRVRVYTEPRPARQQQRKKVWAW